MSRRICYRIVIIYHKWTRCGSESERCEMRRQKLYICSFIAITLCYKRSLWWPCCVIIWRIYLNGLAYIRHIQRNSDGRCKRFICSIVFQVDSFCYGSNFECFDDNLFVYVEILLSIFDWIWCRWNNSRCIWCSVSLINELDWLRDIDFYLTIWCLYDCRSK